MRREDPAWPIRTYYMPSPPARIECAGGLRPTVENVLLSLGCSVRGATLRNSIISPDVVIEKGAVVEDSILFSDVHVGERAHVARAIVDKHVTIPPGSEISARAAGGSRGVEATESGIVVVPKGMALP